ncbi:hypothetical protein ACJX0J_004106 [Zea mays]
MSVEIGTFWINFIPRIYEVGILTGSFDTQYERKEIFVVLFVFFVLLSLNDPFRMRILELLKNDQSFHWHSLFVDSLFVGKEWILLISGLIILSSLLKMEIQ